MTLTWFETEPKLFHFGFVDYSQRSARCPRAINCYSSVRPGAPAGLRPECGDELFYRRAVRALAFICHDASLGHVFNGHMLFAEVRLTATLFYAVGKCGLTADDTLVAHHNLSPENQRGIFQTAHAVVQPIRSAAQFDNELWV